MENKNIIIGAIAIVLLIGGTIWYVSNQESESGRPVQYDVSGEQQQVVNEEQNIEFIYYSGPEGHTLLESTPDTVLEDPLLRKAYTLVPTSRYMVTESTEGIGVNFPAISILIFDAEEEVATTTGVATTEETTEPIEEVGPTVTEWAEEHAGYTVYGLRSSEPEEVTVDGVSGIRFTSDNENLPFISETYVLEYRGKYYLFVGQFQEESDVNWNTFNRLMMEVFFL